MKTFYLILGLLSTVTGLLKLVGGQHSLALAWSAFAVACMAHHEILQLREDTARFTKASVSFSETVRDHLNDAL